MLSSFQYVQPLLILNISERINGRTAQKHSYWYLFRLFVSTDPHRVMFDIGIRTASSFCAPKSVAFVVPPASSMCNIPSKRMIGSTLGILKSGQRSEAFLVNFCHLNAVSGQPNTVSGQSFMSRVPRDTRQS